MKIYKKYEKGNTLRTIRKRISGKRLVVIFLIAFVLIAFGLANIIYGAYLNSTGRTNELKQALFQLSKLNFSFISNNIESKFTDINVLDLDVKFENWEKIRYNREKALRLGEKILNEYKGEVPAKIRFNNQTYKVKISITGGNHEHINHPSKWSLMIKIKNGKTILGMSKFAVLYPRGRGYITDWFATKILKTRGLLGLKTGFIKMNINGKDHGLYYLEERFDSSLLEASNKFNEGIIFRAIGSNLKIYGLDDIKEDKKLSKDIILLKKLWYSFLNDSIKPEQLFDLKKFASLYVCTDLIYNPSEAHALWYGNLRFYFNPITKLIEPIGREWGSISEFNHQPLSKLLIEKKLGDHFFIQNKILKSLTFKEFYIKEAQKLSNRTYLDSIITEYKPEMDQLLDEIHSENPFYEFPLHLIYENQDNIRKKLYPVTPAIEAYYDTISNNNLTIQVVNKINLPIEIKRLTYNSLKIIHPKEKIILLPKFETSEKYKKINIPLYSFDEMDLNSFSTDSIDVVYSVLGLSETIENFNRHVFTFRTILFPKVLTGNDYLDLSSSKQSANIDEFDFLTINKKDKIIEFSNKKCNINKNLIIPNDYVVVANPGCQINLINSAKIVSYSPLLFFGESDEPINIMSSDSSGQGIVVLNSERTSEFSHVNFKALSNVSYKVWVTDGVITFYESPVNINNCNFEGNIRGINYLNVIRTDFNLLNTSFQNTYNNAFNTDFSMGSVENITFDRIGKDAIATIGSELQIKEIQITNLQNIGINGSQNSKIIGKNILINGGKIAILSKDNTSIEIDDINIDASDLAYCTFQEKSGYGPAFISVKNSTLQNVNKKFLIENGSTLSSNGVIIEKKDKNVYETLYRKK